MTTDKDRAEFELAYSAIKDSVNEMRWKAVDMDPSEKQKEAAWISWQASAARSGAVPADRGALVQHAIKLMKQRPWDGKTFDPELAHTMQLLAAAPEPQRGGPLRGRIYDFNDISAACINAGISSEDYGRLGKELEALSPRSGDAPVLYQWSSSQLAAPLWHDATKESIDALKSSAASSLFTFRSINVVSQLADSGTAHLQRPRFFHDHGVVHDLATGRHVCIPAHETTIDEVCDLLNSLNPPADARDAEDARLFRLLTELIRQGDADVRCIMLGDGTQPDYSEFLDADELLNHLREFPADSAMGAGGGR